ncbi:MAG: VanZ family protein [Clostridiales bacterium]|nr:VanZ family protein [Clostridiales bacterium]
MRAVLQSIFITYGAAIFFTTLIFRRTAAAPKAEWAPFWSWYEVMVNHNRSLFMEIVLNLLLFIPVGFCLSILYQIRPKAAFLVGLIWSAAIETLQLVTCRGLFEWDDMLHNGLGCMFGAMAGSAALRLWESYRREYFSNRRSL